MRFRPKDKEFLVTLNYSDREGFSKKSLLVIHRRVQSSSSQPQVGTVRGLSPHVLTFGSFVGFIFDGDVSFQQFNRGYRGECYVIRRSCVCEKFVEFH